MNKRTVAAFFLGAALTFILVRVFQPKEVPPATEPEPALAESRVETPPPRPVTIVPGPVRSRTRTREAPPAAPENQLQNLSLSEESIRQLELSIASLKQIAYTESMPDGWRVRIKREGPPFSATGLRDGDVVTYESLNAEAAKPERALLAARFAVVLNQLER